MAQDVFGIVGTTQGEAFRVEEVVAEGGFAVVYRAFHSAFRASVALKCMKVPAAMAPEDRQRFLERFREEAEVLFRLSSSLPVVVRPLHVGTLDVPDGRFVPFVAMEWLEGETLDRLITRLAVEGKPPLSLKELVQRLTPVAETLAQAHHFPSPQGPIVVVHRDIKPENLFVTRQHGKTLIKILDFGIAKVKSSASQMVGRQSVEAGGIAAFTPAYAAPEQWVPKRFGQTGPWTDVWGLALTIVECLCGYAPLAGDPTQIMGAALDPQRRPTPRGEGVAVSDDVERVFAKALAVDPTQRYQDMATFWRELRAAVRREGDALPQSAVGIGARAASDHSPAPTVASNVAAAAPPQRAPRAQGSAPAAAAERPARAGTSAAPGGSHTLVSGGERPAAPPAPRGGAPQDYLLGNVIEDQSGDPGLASMLELDDGRAAPGRAQQGDVGPGALSRPMAREVGAGFVRPGAGAGGLSGARRGGRPAVASLGQRLRGPLRLLAAAVALVVADGVYTSWSGHAFQLGPARAFWFAAPLALFGAALLLTRLLSGDEP